MNLTSYSDYALRIFIYLGSQPDNPLVTIQEISDTFGISQHHIGKITYDLNKLGYLETVRGRSGGIRLAKAPQEINLGHILRITEGNFHLVECFNEQFNTCRIGPACRLKHILKEALDAYLSVMDSYTLADVLTNAETLRRLLKLS